jgi:hypothetical protein
MRQIHLQISSRSRLLSLLFSFFTGACKVVVASSSKFFVLPIACTQALKESVCLIFV